MASELYCYQRDATAYGPCSALQQAQERVRELERRLTFGARNSDEVQIAIEEGIRVGCEVAEHEKSLAEARVRELELWLDTANQKVDRLAKCEARVKELAAKCAAAEALLAKVREECLMNMSDFRVYDGVSHAEQAMRYRSIRALLGDKGGE